VQLNKIQYEEGFGLDDGFDNPTSRSSTEGGLSQGAVGAKTEAVGVEMRRDVNLRGTRPPIPPHSASRAVCVCHFNNAALAINESCEQ
jgi:hypothetical protein